MCDVNVLDAMLRGMLGLVRTWTSAWMGVGRVLGGVPQVSVVVSVESGACLARSLLECNVLSPIMFRNARIWRPGVPSCLGAFFLAN